jgi:hypothetical protein
MALFAKLEVESYWKMTYGSCVGSASRRSALEVDGPDTT